MYGLSSKNPIYYTIINLLYDYYTYFMIEEISLSKTIDGTKHGLQMKINEKLMTVTNSIGGLNTNGN